ncbi:MAG: TRIC cation channel family protein [Acidobacteriaceae bacterium]
MNLPNFPEVDLFAAAINALNGVLVARNPSHNRGYTVAGLLIMAYFGGIGGGVSRDMLLNDVPGPLKGPIYLIVCPLMGLLGLAIYRYAEGREEQFRTRTLAYIKSFTLPWFAILGAHKALDHGLGIFAAIVIGLIATTAGGVFIDLFSGVTPEIVRPAQQLVTTAVLASTVYTLIAVSAGGRHFFPVTLIAVLVAFVFRVFAVRDHWGSFVPLVAPGEGPAAQA